MAEYTTIERSIHIDAPPSAIQPHVVDFEKWRSWSPWEKADPGMSRSYAGEQGGPGASYSWDGNRRAGSGTMTAATITPGSFDFDLVFTRPFKSSSAVHFAFDQDSDGAGTTVRWTMTSPKTTASRIMGVIMNMDKLIGSDLADGLATLRKVVERSNKS